MKERNRVALAIVCGPLMMGILGCVSLSILDTLGLQGGRPTISVASVPSHPPQGTPQGAAPAAQTVAPTTAPSAAAPVRPSSPVRYAALTDRAWLGVARNPDAYIGRTYLVFGVVTQADVVTGTENVRADCGGKRRYPSYGFVDYPTNTILHGTLGALVEGDLFEAWVTVAGSITYDLALGGTTTAPLLAVDRVKVLGSIA